MPDDFRVVYPDGHPAKRTLGEMADRRRQGLPVRAGYTEGDEWRPRNAPRHVIERLQRDLFLAGLLGPDDTITPGRFDATTRAAYKRLLAEANAMGVADGDALEELKSFPLIPETKKSEGRPLTVKLDNPNDIRYAMREKAIEVLGSNRITDAQMDRLVKAWHNLQRQTQTQAYNTAPTGGTVTEGPSFETFAETEIRKADPVGFDAHEALSGFDMLIQLMQGDTPRAA